MGWRLLRASDLFKVLNKLAGRVSGRVLVRQQCIRAIGVLYQGKWEESNQVSASKAV